MHTDRIAAFMVCALLAACGERGPTTPADRDADVAAIAGVNERILGALNAGDWARLNELTDASYVAIIGGNPIAGQGTARGLESAVSRAMARSRAMAAR